MVGAGSSSDCDDIGLRHSYVKEGITIADIFGKSLEELEKGFDDYILDTPIKNV